MNVYIASFNGHYLEGNAVVIEETKRYDKELEAYGQLQMKKLQELEFKAQEIRAELAKKEVG